LPSSPRLSRPAAIRTPRFAAVSEPIAARRRAAHRPADLHPRVGAEHAAYDYQPAPQLPQGPVAGGAREHGLAAVRSLIAGRLDRAALESLAASRDPRQAWLLSDLLRFAQSPDDEQALVEAFARVTGRDPREDPEFGDSASKSVTNHLIAWNLPTAPAYVATKAELFGGRSRPRRCWQTPAMCDPADGQRFSTPRGWLNPPGAGEVE